MTMMVVASPKLRLKQYQQQHACWRNVEWRSSRVPKDDSPCDDESEVKENGICYGKCHADQEGNGPACWSKCRCRFGYSSLFFCCNGKSICDKTTLMLYAKLPLNIVELFLDISAKPKDAQKIWNDFQQLSHTALNLVLPMCHTKFETGCEHEEEGQLVKE